MSEPRYCEIAGKYCHCNLRCRDDDTAAVERKTYCGCDKGDLTQRERETRKCQRCGKQL